MITPGEVAARILPREGHPQWFFNEMMRIQTRMDQIKGHDIYFDENPENLKQPLEKLQLDLSAMIKRAQAELTHEQSHRIGIMFINATKGE